MKYYKSEIETEITSLLNGIDINKYTIEKDDWKVSIFICFFDDAIALDESWKDISNSIASSFQAKLKGRENEFEKWNIYILYVCKNEVNKETKNKIENDKFSSRKIVEDNFEEKHTNIKIEELLIKHITNTDLIVSVNNETINTESSYASINHEVWEIIPKKYLISGEVEEQKDLLEQLKTLKNEN